MLIYHDEFAQRQTINSADFEFYHYLDMTPPAVDFHSHGFYEVFFFLSGNVRYTVDGRAYQLRPSDILLTNTRDIHRPEISPGKPYERYVLWLNAGFLQSLSRPGDDLTACFTDAAKKKYRLIRPYGETLTQLQTLCRRILFLQRENAFGSATLLYAALTALLVYLNRAYFDTPDTIRQDVVENNTVNQIVDYLEEHLTEDLSLDGLADIFHQSKFYISRQFKDFTGISLYQFVMKKRLLSARAMLQAGCPVMTACMDCGFGDYSNFLKAFKREFGLNPKEYRPN